MTTIASCGHDIDGKKYYALNTMNFKTDFNESGVTRCVSFGVYCEECKDAYERFGIVIHSMAEQRDWLSGKTSYPVIDIHAWLFR